jgi:predicted Fe-Mo cluster-binding NifX family protein
MRKIALITDDGQAVSKHFGRALYYQVVSVDDGQVVSREMRSKSGHSQFASEPGAHEITEGHQHGSGPAAEARHTQMAQTIDDCEAVICGGMGSGAYFSLMRRGIKPVVTEVQTIDEAVLAYIEGRLVNREDLLH